MTQLTNRRSEDRTKRLAAFYAAKGLVRTESGVLVTASEAKASGVGPARVAAKTGHKAPSNAAGIDLQRAEARARLSERRRWEAVMLSDVAKGREEIAAAMLAGGDESAETIRAKLASMPTDAERAARAARVRENAASAVWDKAIAAIYPEKETRHG